MCDITTNGEEQLALHMHGRRHYRHLQQQGEEPVRLPPHTFVMQEVLDTGEVKCELCDVTMPDTDLAASHLM